MFDRFPLKYLPSAIWSRRRKRLNQELAAREAHRAAMKAFRESLLRGASSWQRKVAEYKDEDFPTIIRNLRASGFPIKSVTFPIGDTGGIYKYIEFPAAKMLSAEMVSAKDGVEYTLKFDSFQPSPDTSSQPSSDSGSSSPFSND